MTKQEEIMREQDPYNLPLTVMPLVHLMKDANITWAQRQDISGAIRECIRNYRSLMSEATERSPQCQLEKR